ncbi:hypothetical protein ACS0TY_001717 [Phlomoides rotata]
MICICADSHLCTFTLILYTCVCIPFLQTTQLILRIFTFLVNPHEQRSENAQLEDTPICNLDLSSFAVSGCGISQRKQGISRRESEGQRWRNDGGVFETGAAKLNESTFSTPSRKWHYSGQMQAADSLATAHSGASGSTAVDDVVPTVAHM